jgi:steroid delta-isomerase-like uncharacterized protein
MPSATAHGGSRAAGAAAAKHVMRRYFEDAWGRGDTSVLGELVAPTVTVHSQYEHVQVLPPPGPQACSDEVRLYRAAIPDLRVTVLDQVAERDLVMTRWEAQGTHLGPLLGVPATGRPVRLASLYFVRLDAQGRIAETRNSWDGLALHQQLGLTGTDALPYAPSPRDGAWPATEADAAAPDAPAAGVVRRLFATVYETGSPQHPVGLVHDDHRTHENLAEPVLGGPGLVMERLAALRQEVPDARLRLDTVIGEGAERAAYCWTLTGTAPTGRPFSVMGGSISELRGGLLARTWHCYDALPFLQAADRTPHARGVLGLIG